MQETKHKKTNARISGISLYIFPVTLTDRASSHIYIALVILTSVVQ
jgi:hypothetical protein